jgi:hypothetical protein
MAVDRRGFCKLAGLGALGLAGAAAAKAAVSVRDAQGSATAEVAEPILGKRWAMVVDLQACRKEEGWSPATGSITCRRSNTRRTR